MSADRVEDIDVEVEDIDVVDIEDIEADDIDANIDVEDIDSEEVVVVDDGEEIVRPWSMASVMIELPVPLPYEYTVELPID